MVPSRFPAADSRRFALISLVLALALSGCASTSGRVPNGAPTDANSLATTRSFSASVASDAAFPAQDWWTTLGDRQLDALIAEALVGTPSLDAADARLRQAIAQAGLADAGRKPNVGAGAQYSGLLIPESVVAEPIGGHYAGIELLTLNFNYSPDLWGGKRARWEAALGQARAAEIDAQAARLSLSSNIARTYIVLAQAHAAQGVALADQQRGERLLGLGRQRAKAGLDSQLPVRQAESAVASAKQQAQAAQQQIDAARNALAALLGQGPDRGVEITAPTLLAAPSPALPAVMPSELLGHRPDVVAARWRVEAALQGIKSSKADFYPTVNLGAMVGLASSGLSNLFTANALLVQGGPAISLPIFDGGKRRNQLARSDADYDLAVATYNQNLVGALHEVADALQAARSLDAQIASTTQARDAVQAAWQLGTTRYRAGLGTQIDVLTAQRPLLQIDQQLAALRAQRLLAAVDLDRALGGGLVLTAPAVESTSSSDSDFAKAPTP